MKKLRMFGIVSAAAVALTAITSAGLSAFAAASVGEKLSVSQNGEHQYKDKCDGYSYEIWLDKTGGSGSMTLGAGGTFDTEWDARCEKGNFLARRGMDFDRTRKATDCGDITLDFAAEYSASDKGNSRLCVYGWFVDPLIEYYIIEDWVNWCPQPNGPSQTVTIDGSEYEIFTLPHEGPTILDNQSRQFTQYFSVRKTKRTSGTISVSEHFKAWEKAGLEIGNLTEVALNVEGWESSGRANVTKLEFVDPIEQGTGVATQTTEPGTTEPTLIPEPTVSYEKPTDTGEWISDTIDNEKLATVWSKRGNEASYGITSDWAHSGKRSLYITDRKESWHGFSAEGGNEMKAGKNYIISAYTGYRNDNFDSVTFNIGLQYDLDGKKNYDDLATEACKSGEWVRLYDEFSIPEGATNISLYVQTKYTETPTAADLVSFYMDDVVLMGDEVMVGTRPQFPEETEPEATQTTETTQTTAELTVTTGEETKPVAATKPVDVNGDGKVTVSDAILLARIVAEDSTATVTDAGRANGELDGTEGLSADDTVILLKMLAGLA